MIPTLLAQINPSHWPTYVLFLIFVLVGFAIILCIFLAKYANLWLQAKMTSASITILELVGMSFRKVNPNIIVRSKIMAYQAGLSEKDGITTRAPGGPLPGRRQRAERRPRPDRRQPRRHPAVVQAGRGDRPGRPQRAGGRADQRQSQGDPLPRPELGAEQHRRRGQERHPAQGQGEGHGADQPRPPSRRRDRRDDHRAGRRGHRQRHRLGRHPRAGAGEAGHDLQARAGEGPRRRHGLRDPLDRHRRRRRRATTSAPISRRSRPRPTRGWPAPRPRSGGPSPSPRSRR